MLLRQLPENIGDQTLEVSPDRLQEVLDELLEGDHFVLDLAADLAWLLATRVKALWNVYADIALDGSIRLGQSLAQAGLDLGVVTAMARNVDRDLLAASHMHEYLFLKVDEGTGIEMRFEAVDRRLIESLGDIGEIDRKHFAALAERRLPRGAAERFGAAGDLGTEYLAYLVVLWWSSCAVAWAVSEPIDADGLEAHRKLSPSATVQSAKELEAFSNTVHQWIDSDRLLSPEDESYLRGELDIIRGQHRVMEGADAYYIRRAVGKIVQRLIELEIVGHQVRQVLIELGAEPPEVVDEIVKGMKDFLEIVADQWAESNLDPAKNPSEAARPFSQAAESARSLQLFVTRVIESIPAGIGETLGASLVLGVGPKLLSSVSAVGSIVGGTAGIDAVAYSLIEAAPQLFRIYTYVKPSGAKTGEDS